MSFSLISRQLRLRAPATLHSRAISTSPILSKTLTDSVKDAAEKLNKVAGDTVLKGINLGEEVADKAAPLVGKAKEAAGDVATEAQKKGSDASNVANKAASDVKTAADKTAADVKNAANKA